MAPNFLEPGRYLPCTPSALTFSGHLLPAPPLHYRKSPLLQRKQNKHKTWKEPHFIQYSCDGKGNYRISFQECQELILKF